MYQQPMFQSQQSNIQPMQQQNPSQFHLTNYRGNQSGHDAYKRADTNNYSFQAAAPQSSQPTYQPAGFVPSVYQGNNQASTSTSGYQPAQSHMTYPQSYQSAQSHIAHPQSYQSAQSHIAHPQSYQSAQSHIAHPQSYQSTQSQMSQPQSYHLTNYRGNQPGHDAYKRQNSIPTSSMTFGFGSQIQNQQQPYQPTGFVPSMYQSNQQQGTQNQTMQPTTMNRNQISSFNQQQQPMSTNPQSYHLTNYRGNMPGHVEFANQNQSSSRFLY
ncbi:hypothetical protein [Chengkuizengella axinellae]|uniref:Uncharacterized protein n=1 Tax=Chengkuizengella axinellae TaxID=3064388 RepID=A0ABT9IWX5_9BACL|nr:hypothetical protein [Chengkuizengella sp. 2205SS18-9]MDP5273314.1 hypothetical protein [Chengkuizengella sp. 2205SS18-9]